MSNRSFFVIFTWMVCEFLNKVAGSLFEYTADLSEIDGQFVTYKDNSEHIATATIFDVQNSTIIDLYDPYANNDIAFWPAFVETLSVTLVTELGDNTFFTAAILAMQHPRIIVFIGALTALTVMNALSVSLSMVMSIIPKMYTYYASTAMLVYFGTRMLRDAYCMSPLATNGFDAMQEDMEERKKKRNKQINDKNDTLQVASPTGNGTETITEKKPITCRNELNLKGIDVLIKVFTTVLLAEFGDRSQLTTFVLSTRKNALGVIVGGTLGRTFSTAAAVIGGRMIAQRISVRTVTAIGGILFLMFAFSSTISNGSNLGAVSV